MQPHTQPLGALRLVPQYHDRVWGGKYLKPDAEEPVGEAWIVSEEDEVASGPHEGRTLAEIAEEYGEALLGRLVTSQTDSRFPLLVKLLDCGDWLSLQVHPNDEQAVELEGPEHFGKTEAWHVLEAEPGARLISGVKPGTPPESLAEAIREGTVVELAQYLDVQKGDTILTHAGTVHALGPGLLIYEVQQTSDITYRIYDWDRPQANGRKLHIEQSVTVSNPGMTGEVCRMPHPLRDGDRHRLVCCDYFTLELLSAERQKIELDTGGETFHALTVIEGEMQVEGDGWREELGKYDSVVVPASAGKYTVKPLGKFQALKSSVEPTDDLST
ncbi:MAG: class I mannose-6-phosphate isomerase [Chloroflexota bacterium]|nr:class I mannose-6-phosphate isomerase [Chloroflexota bacterium]